MSFYRREIRVGNSLLLREASGSWIRIDVLSLEGMRVQIGVDAPIDYPSRNAGRRNLVIGPIRVFVLKRIGQQKIQFGVRAPGNFSVVRNDGGSSDSEPSKGQVANTGTNARVQSRAMAEE
jgi:sRNA-binding carbon storage regulator CsrA